MAAQDNRYNLFSKIQTLFFTSIPGFNELSNYEIKQCAFMLLNSIGKGFPQLSHVIINIYSPHVKAIESPEIIKALQHKFVNPYQPRQGMLPQFVFYKNLEDKSQKAKASKRTTKKGDEFSQDIVAEICRIMLLDTKDYETLKYTPRVQYLGNQILGEFMKKEKRKSLKK